MSFNQDWKISPADEEYPPLSLLIFGSCIFLNSCVAAWSPILSEWLLKTGLGGKATCCCRLHRVDVKLPLIMSTNFTCLGWWLGVKLSSSASMSSNEALFIMGVAIVVECEVTAVPHLVLTIPGIKLKISYCMTSNQDSEHDVEALGSHRRTLRTSWFWQLLNGLL